MSDAITVISDEQVQPFKYVLDGYFEYSNEVIVQRALSDYRDGFKPVQRRIVYTSKTTKKGDYGKTLTKCHALNGTTMAKYHPHGDKSIYEALVLMTDVYGGMQLPLIKGSGEFGGYYKTDKAADSRYTECSLTDYALEAYFGEMNGVRFVPNFDNTESEPEVLPVKYPAVLCNSSIGIAVGFSQKTIQFNFNDVIDLTLEYLETGDIKTLIYPDFQGGGYLINDRKELERLMRVGKGRLKVRGKYYKEGKTFHIYEYPCGKTIQSLIKSINKAEIPGISGTSDYDDLTGNETSVICSAKNKMDDVERLLLKNTDLQSTYSVNLTLIIDGAPRTLGVWDIIKKWVPWRREVLTREYTIALENFRASVRKPLAFMEVMKYPDKKDIIVELASQVGTAEAIQYVLDNFDNDIIDRELAKWVVKQGLDNFLDGGSFKKDYNTILDNIKHYEYLLANIDSVIIKQMKELKTKWGSRFPRKTEVTNTDYIFTTEEVEDKVVDETLCDYIIKENFIKKMIRTPNLNTTERVVQASASDVLVATDSEGRLLRIYCENLPYSTSRDTGTYLPTYFDISADEDYKVTWFGVLDGSTKMIVYKDGNTSFLDTSTLSESARRVKVNKNGIPASVADIIGAVIDLPEESNLALTVVDTKGKIGIVYLDTVKRKNSDAKTRVFTLDKDSELAYYALTTIGEAMGMLSNHSYYQNKLRYLESVNAFNGDDALVTMM